MFIPKNSVIVTLCLVLCLITSFSGCGASEECKEHLDAILKLEEWGLKMLDATSKLKSGILEGNFYDLGSFDECLGIEHELPNHQVVRGKYCQMITKLQLPGAPLLLPHSGCIPASCKADSEEVQNFFDNLIKTLNLNAYLNVTLLENTCQTHETIHQKPEPGDWVVIIIIIFLISMAAMSTIYDYYIQRVEKKPANELLIAFSLYTNTKKLIAISESKEILPCLNGLRSISMIWVILGHRYNSLLSSTVINGVYALQEWPNEFWSYYILGSTVSVDTFFFLGGLLICYGAMKSMSKGIKFNVPLFYIHRYLRLTPAMMAVIVFYITLLKFVADGPYMPNFASLLKEPCKENWWVNMLYLQNYVNAKNMCLQQTWYLGVDMQLFILTPFVLMPLFKWPKATLAFLGLLTVGSFIIPFVVAYVNEFDLRYITKDPEMPFMLKYYYATHCRFGTYLIGIITGFLIYEMKRKNFNFKNLPMPYVINTIGWGLALGTLFAVLFGSYNLAQHDFDRVATSIFIAFSRNSWAIALAWVVFSCTFGFGGIIDWFLSLPVFQVLSRLTYSMYLTHGIIEGTRDASSRVNLYYSNNTAQYMFWGDFWYTLFFSVFVTLIFEYPVFVIEKVIFRPCRPKPIANKGSV